MRILILLLCLPSIAFGLDVILQVDGQTIRTLDADRVNVITDDQRVLIDVRTKPKSSPQPPPVDPPKPPDSACGQRPRNVSIVNTGPMTQRFNKTTYEPDPRTIIAFAFTTPDTGNYRGRATATRTSSADKTKLLSLSACPGDYKNPVALSNACLQIGWEAVQITFTTDPDSQSECVLERGRTYYLNATSHRRFNSDDLSCTTRQDCGFTFAREPS